MSIREELRREIIEENMVLIAGPINLGEQWTRSTVEVELLTFPGGRWWVVIDLLLEGNRGPQPPIIVDYRKRP